VDGVVIVLNRVDEDFTAAILHAGMVDIIDEDARQLIDGQWVFVVVDLRVGIRTEDNAAVIPRRRAEGRTVCIAPDCIMGIRSELNGGISRA
jgi:hypothetical protein